MISFLFSTIKKKLNFSAFLCRGRKAFSLLLKPYKLFVSMAFDNYDYQKIIGYFGFFYKLAHLNNKKYIRKVAICIVASFFLISMDFYPTLAYVMESSQYRIQSDSLNVGGGNWDSTNYIFEDTMGEIASGPSASTSYKLKAGYQQMQEVYISASSPSDIILTPAFGGVTGGLASGSAAWTIICDGAAGFDIKIKASSDPAMKNDDTYYFDDYTPIAAGSPDYDWNSPSSTSAEFGFTVEPETAADTASLFTDNNSDSCGVGGSTNTSDKCWFDFNGTNNIDIVHRTTRTDSDGENETVKFRAESNAKFLKEGYYDATIIITVVPN